MSQIYSEKHLAHYAQVILFDPDAENSIPEWGDDQNFASGSSGVQLLSNPN